MIVDATASCASADAAVFVPVSRAVEVAARVRRLNGRVTVGATYMRAEGSHPI